MPKRIQISSDDITYHTLPGNTGELRDEAGELTDTIFGQPFESSESGLITASISANALYKGFAGYIVKLMKGGTPVAMTAEPMSLVVGKTYTVTATTKQFIDPATTMNVFVAAVNQNAQVERVDYPLGEVTFKSTYTVSGAVTITGAYVPTTAIAGARTFNLTQTEAVIDNTDIVAAKANGGFRTYVAGGLKSVALEIGGIFSVANAFRAALIARAPIYIEINPDNSNLSICRGVFKYSGRAQSGDLGALEEENLTLRLYVPPEQASGLPWGLPFGWNHSASSTLSQAVQKSLNSWQDSTVLYAKYLYDGLAGFKAPVLVTDISLSGGLESMNEFTANYQVNGAATVV